MQLRRSARVLRQAAAERRDGAKPLPEATIGRLPDYHRALVSFTDRGYSTISSEELANASGVNPAKLRKDLSLLGSGGVRGVGYDVAGLLSQISTALGYTHEWPVVICGFGHLGQALANYSGFGDRGVRIVGLIDADPTKVGTAIALPSGRIVVEAPERIEEVVRTHHASIGVVAVPASSAQSVCDRLVAGGIRSILNFAPIVLSVPREVTVRKVDLFSELQILAFHEQQRQAAMA